MLEYLYITVFIKRCREKLRFPHQSLVPLAEEYGKLTAVGGRQEENKGDREENVIIWRIFTLI